MHENVSSFLFTDWFYKIYDCEQSESKPNKINCHVVFYKVIQNYKGRFFKKFCLTII